MYNKKWAVKVAKSKLEKYKDLIWSLVHGNTKFPTEVLDFILIQDEDKLKVYYDGVLLAVVTPEEWEWL